MSAYKFSWWERHDLEEEDPLSCASCGYMTDARFWQGVWWLHAKCPKCGAVWSVEALKSRNDYLDDLMMRRMNKKVAKSR